MGGEGGDPGPWDVDTGMNQSTQGDHPSNGSQCMISLFLFLIIPSPGRLHLCLSSMCRLILQRALAHAGIQSYTHSYPALPQLCIAYVRGGWSGL